jgi:hypothetical protein
LLVKALPTRLRQTFFAKISSIALEKVAPGKEFECQFTNKSKVNSFLISKSINYRKNLGFAFFLRSDIRNRNSVIFRKEDIMFFLSPSKWFNSFIFKSYSMAS